MKMLIPTLFIFVSQSLRKLKLGAQVVWAALLSEVEVAEYRKGPVVPNTTKNTQWAVRVFSVWCTERNKKDSQEKCPEDVLGKQPFTEQLNYWLSQFMLEARRADGSQYPSTTIYQLLCGLLRHARSIWKECPNFLDRQNSTFVELRGTCNRLSRELRQAGIAATVKHAAVISAEEEDKLWENGAMYRHPFPEGCHAVYFTMLERLFVFVVVKSKIFPIHS